MLRSGTVHASFGPRMVEHSRGVVEDLADLDAAPDQVGAGLTDVVDGELQAFERTG